MVHDARSLSHRTRARRLRVCVGRRTRARPGSPPRSTRQLHARAACAIRPRVERTSGSRARRGGWSRDATRVAWQRVGGDQRRPASRVPGGCDDPHRNRADVHARPAGLARARVHDRSVDAGRQRHTDSPVARRADRRGSLRRRGRAGGRGLPDRICGRIRIRPGCGRYRRVAAALRLGVSRDLQPSARTPCGGGRARGGVGQRARARARRRRSGMARGGARRDCRHVAEARGVRPSRCAGERRDVPRPSRGSRTRRELHLHVRDAGALLRVSLSGRPLRRGAAALGSVHGSSRPSSGNHARARCGRRPRPVRGRLGPIGGAGRPSGAGSGARLSCSDPERGDGQPDQRVRAVLLFARRPVDCVAPDVDARDASRRSARCSC